MKTFEILIFGAAPKTLTIQAESLQAAFNRAKRSEIDSEANWDMCPIWQGEKRVDTTFKLNGRKYRVTVIAKQFT